MNLKKIKNFANSWGLFILMTIVLFKSCGTSSEVKDAAEATQNTSVTVDSTLNAMNDKINRLEKKIINKKQARDIMEKIMLDFLIYENEIDNKEITIFEIKNKIKEND